MVGGHLLFQARFAFQWRSLGGFRTLSPLPTSTTTLPLPHLPCLPTLPVAIFNFCIFDWGDGGEVKKEKAQGLVGLRQGCLSSYSPHLPPLYTPSPAFTTCLPPHLPTPSLPTHLFLSLPTTGWVWMFSLLTCHLLPPHLPFPHHTSPLPAPTTCLSLSSPACSACSACVFFSLHQLSSPHACPLSPTTLPSFLPAFSHLPFHHTLTFPSCCAFSPALSAPSHPYHPSSSLCSPHTASLAACIHTPLSHHRISSHHLSLGQVNWV